MESSQNNTKSFFDTLEEKSDKPQTFEWKTNSSLFKYDKEDLLFENTLFSIKLPKVKLSKHSYILTIQNLYKTKVLIKVII